MCEAFLNRHIHCNFEKHWLDTPRLSEELRCLLASLCEKRIRAACNVQNTSWHEEFVTQQCLWLRSLVRDLLAVDPARRPTAAEVLDHPFWKSCAIPPSHLRWYQLKTATAKQTQPPQQQQQQREPLQTLAPPSQPMSAHQGAVEPQKKESVTRSILPEMTDQENQQQNPAAAMSVL